MWTKSSTSAALFTVFFISQRSQMSTEFSASTAFSNLHFYFHLTAFSNLFTLQILHL
jgi:hypothetical protein